MTVKEFEKHFHTLYLPLSMYALRIVADNAEAEDVVQDAFERVWHLLGDDKAVVANFKAFMYRTVHNLAVSRLRSRIDTCNLDMCEEVAADDIDTSERDAALWRAIDALPEKCRAVFLLSKRDGLSHSEIAEQLGISTKTVENQITKANKALRGTLSRNIHLFFFPFL
jgi:RNA polymerase sigma-70 factor (ECF subfamily)